MKSTLLIVADGARCRLIAAKSSEDEAFEPAVELVECDALANPEALLQEQNIYSDAGGRNRSHAGGPAHGYDDHRQRHHEEMLRKFARDIVVHAENAMQSNQLVQLLLLANSRLLGALREQLPPRMHEKVVMTIEEDATKKNLDELRRLLQKRGLIPERRVQPGYGARG
ncbi:MAG TPA: host attachment protein [Polyangiaceae bacterium]|nr:host attachment protein [Polyangiaceae bacterium]